MSTRGLVRAVSALEQIGERLHRRQRVLYLTLGCESLGQRPKGASPKRGVFVADESKRCSCVLDRGGAAVDAGFPAPLLDQEPRLFLGLRTRTEKRLCGLEMSACLLDLVACEQDLGIQ